jgi:PKD repeat protein
MKKITTKALLTLLLTICAVCFSVINANNLSMNNTNAMQYDTTCFAWFSYEKLGNGKIAFTDSSWVNEAQGDSAISWNWTFGDGTTSVLKNPIHIYATNVTKVTVCLTVKTKQNITCSRCREIQIRPDTSQTCTADFGYSRMLMDDSTKVYFYDQSSGSSEIAWRRWSFSDSAHYTDSAFVHAFDPNLSSATVCLTIGTESGCQASVCKEINLKNCIADFSYTSQGNGTVNFYNKSMVVVNFASWNWQFGDGTTSNQMNPVHTYAPGTTQAYVCLTVRAAMDTCTTCKLIYIQSIPDSCQANFVYQRVNLGSKTPQFQFTDVSITDSPITWRNWTISDSSTYTDSTFIHGFTYPTTVATVCLSIGTSSGCSSSVCKTINITDTIIPTQCKANFSYIIVPDSMSASPLPRTWVYFNDLSYSTDSIVYWSWNFGDGTFSNLRNPSHLYSFVQDSVMVTLKIESLSGCVDSMVQFIYIPVINPLYSMSGTVEGKNELLPQGIMVLYKKADNGFFMLHDANLINNGLFSFSGLNAGKYVLYAMPHMYLSEKYFPTYYVNKLHWANAQIIDLNSNIGGLTLKMVSTRILEKGIGTISGTIINNNETTKQKSARLKSIMSELATPVYLYTPSGEVLSMSLTDENNTFSFDELPYGTYVLRVESLNLQDYETTITISPEVPEVNDVVFNLANPVSIKDLNQSAKLTVRNVDANNIAVRVSKGGVYTITVIGLSGKTIVNNTINLETNSDKVISLGSAPKGIYILKLQNKSNSVFTKFLK